MWPISRSHPASTAAPAASPAAPAPAAAPETAASGSALAAIGAGAGGIGTLLDVSKNQTGPSITTVWAGINGRRDLEFEEFAFDRLQDERGRMIKDISHEGCRYLTPAELRRVLAAKIPGPGYRTDRYGRWPATIRRKRKK